MSINRICSCKSIFSLSESRCPSCGRHPIDKFKVRVRVPLNPGYKWLTKVTDTLEQAVSAEKELKLKAESERQASRVLSPTPRAHGPAHVGENGYTEQPPDTKGVRPGTVNYAWAKYLPYIEDRNKSWRDDLGRFMNHIEPVVGDKPMSAVTPQDVLSCLGSSNLSPASRHRVLALLKRLFNWSIKFDLHDGTNPCLKVDPPRYDNSRHRYLSDDEKDRLLKSLSVDRNKDAVRVIRFLLLTGRRRGEVLSLEWSDVDFNRSLITFRHTKNGKIQTIPINHAALEIVREGLKNPKNRVRPGLVFPSSSGKYFHSFNRSWGRIRKRAKLKDFRLHDLRHTFASVLASSGKVDIYTLQRLLGHSQISMTQRYAHLMPGALRDASEVALELITPVNQSSDAGSCR